MDFEWDARKAEANRRKHGVSFEEATEAFGDDNSITVPDPDHSADGGRFILFGLARNNRFVVVAFTERNSRFRIINARQMARRERRAYDQ